MGILLLLLPICFVRSLAGIGYFSIVILVFTFVAIGIIIYICIVIIGMSPEEANSTYGLHLKDDDRDYVGVDWIMVPVFCATMMTLFEGNQQILNLYAEADQPESFFMIAVMCIVVLTIFIASAIGYLGYLAFGA
jgi:hypothetical protein